MKPCFYVVDFPSDNSVEAVPSNWLFDGNKKCHWPDLVDDLKINSLIQKCAEPSLYPNIKWLIYACEIRLGVDSYEKAQIAAERSVDVSDVELSESDGPSTATPKIRLRKRKNLNKVKNPFVSPRTISNGRAPQTNCRVTPEAGASEDPVHFHLSGLEELTGSNEETSYLGSIGNIFSTATISAPPDTGHTATATEVATDVVLDQTTYPLFTNLDQSQQLHDVNAEIDSLTSEFKKFTEIFAKEFVKLQTEIQHISRMVSKSSEAGVNEECEIEFQLPIDDTAKLPELNTWLQTKENRTKFVSFLKGIGGDTVEHFVRRILQRIIGGACANSMNFTGTGSKAGLKGHAVIACIITAVRKRPDDTDPSEAAVENLIARWLLGSGDRNGGRAERSRRAQQKNN